MFFKLSIDAMLNITTPITNIELAQNLMLLLLLNEIVIATKIKVIILTGYIPAKK